ncbi:MULTISPECIES: GNAT family N-acetyltransferase [Corallincola]|uniref:GNAT family N-acetyltransferase n=3 Tax=Corallincola TaxID=1775176 RepID=A0A368NGY2_9GAMM|nr:MULTISPECIES: GNAT family N-acetyltransferase [Corallincola]RCU48894.1 GNAT family N-acetyltransferase [Corallincola holothuriorum]TAA43786.1 GNAT family N-acetyltransferase [Corallincola spongiicola]TCI03033.1 GNAT family N-acetyltransferase [Corallincola luteus]
MQPFKWSILSFEQLSKAQLIAILKLRQQVFMLEQNSLYLDIDGEDEHCSHLLVEQDNVLIGYARLAPPASCHPNYPVLGRIVLAKQGRGVGLGEKLIKTGLDTLAKWYPGVAIKISAQQALVPYYQQFGFEEKGEPYDDGGVMHLDMLLLPTR